MSDSVSESVPTDLLAVGHVLGAWGVRGWIKVSPDDPQADALLRAKQWWLQRTGLPAPASLRTVRLARRQGSAVVALLQDMESRDAAEELRGCTILIRRADFPPAEDGSFYWADLIGCSVVGAQGEDLGTVVGLLDNAAHATLRIAPPQGTVPDGKQFERLIPFVDAIVPTVDLAARRITTTWDASYF